jgi:hypothetical protein
VNAEVWKKVAEIQAGLANALHDNIFAHPTPEMLQARMVHVLSQLVGDHAKKIAQDHMRVSQVHDSLVFDMDGPMVEIITSVFGQDITSVLLPCNQITLEGWSKPVPVCDAIDETVVPSSKSALPVARPEDDKPKPTGRPKSRDVWQGD